MRDSDDSDLHYAREFAWKHFDFHAKQRIDMFKAYLTLITVAYASFGFVAQSKIYAFGIAFSALSIVFSIIFYFFDRRTRQLIRISEAFLLKDELKIANAISDRDIRLFRKSDLITHAGKNTFRLTYTSLFQVLFLANVIVSAFALLMFTVYSMTSDNFFQ